MPTKKPAPKSKLPYRTPTITGPIPAPPVTNYAGLLEQIAMSLQDLVAETRTMSQAMSSLSASIVDYLKDVDDDDVVDVDDTESEGDEK